MSVPHKHAAVIKAWADGFTVQERVMRCGEWQEWKDVFSHAPTFWTDSCYQFRVKPKPDINVFAHVHRRGHYSAEITVTCEHNWNKTGLPSYTDPCNITLVFDGESGELKDAKVIK